VDCCEVNYTLREILELKGHSLIHDNFTTLEPVQQYDAVVMNPPFEKWQDIAHIQHALQFVKPGGKVVAICAGGPKQVEQLQPIADHWEALPTGAFKESGTGVNTVLAVFSA
jgi:16S rRNA G1207 methylase RsmC